MIVSITGGSGFIGKRLVKRHLEQGDVVKVLSRNSEQAFNSCKNLLIFQGDLIDGSFPKDFLHEADVLYHCAGEIRDVSKMEQLHIYGTSCLVEAARGQIKRWVQLSSTGAYGVQRSGVVTELTSSNPEGIYESTKVGADKIVMQSAANGAFECSILRPSIVYGVDMPNQSLIALIRAIEQGLFFFIGKPGASANYIHVDNVVEALMLCGVHASASGRVYNLSDYRTLEQFVEIISSALGRKPPKARLSESTVRLLAKLLGQIRGFPLTESRVDALTGFAQYATDKIESELGYRNIVSMEKGLAELVAHRGMVH